MIERMALRDDPVQCRMMAKMNGPHIAENLLKNNGVLVCKLFQGSELQKFMNRLKSFFGKTKLFKPEASRMKSSEIYAVGLNFKKPSDIIEKEENSLNKL